MASEEVDRAELATRLRARAGSNERALLAMFIDGRYAIEGDRLKRAYKIVLADFVDDAEDTDRALRGGALFAQSARSKRHLRDLREQIRRAHPSGRVGEGLLGWATDGLSLVLGRGNAEQRARFVAGFLDTIEGRAVADQGQRATTALATHAINWSAGKMLDEVNRESMPSLIRSRDFVVAFVEEARAWIGEPGHPLTPPFVARFIADLSPVSLALAVPGTARLYRVLPEQMIALERGLFGRVLNSPNDV